MKIVQIKDLLRYKMVQIAAPEGETLVSQQKILLDQAGDAIVAKVVSGNRNLPGAKVDNSYEFKKILTQAEFEKFETNDVDSFERVKQARDLTEKLALKMHIFASRSSFDGKIISFFFVSQENVDFRELVKDLARQFKKRIHLQRVTARERAQIVGGIGVCGREDCCSFLKFTPEQATMDCVRDQGIMIKHNSRIYGLSGKIKDCFLYEWDFYRQQRRYFPHIKQKVKANGRLGRVKNVDILSQKVKVLFEEGVIDVFDIRDISYENQVKLPDEPAREIKFPAVDILGDGSLSELA